MKVAVVGAGAIGSTYAWKLAAAGHDVTLVDVWREHVETVARDGLVVELPDGSSSTVAVAAVTDAAAVGSARFVLVATKSYATDDAARSAALCADDATWIGTVQNGLGNDTRLAAVLGADRVLPGATTVGAEMAGPGRVRPNRGVVAGQSLTSFGRPRTAAAMPESVRALCAELTATGLPAEALDDVDYVIWRKLCLAGSMGALGAVLRSTVGDVVEDADARGLLTRMIDEIVAVGQASGVALDRDEIHEHAAHTFATVGKHPPSMAVDVALGRRTEIDAFCLEIARLGRERGVATPANEVVGQLVKALEPARGVRGSNTMSTGRPAVLGGGLRRPRSRP
ncbi:MAG: 2-dehydropantoate 2-reductase [Actinobacteria bacterium]|nr:2-dehydropantoate 2-reductase [Actinomycetota bacterium]